MSRRFMLDADMISYALRGRGNVGVEILNRPSWQLCMSAITLAELRFGAEKLQSSKYREAVEKFSRGIETIPFAADAAMIYGVIRANLERTGTKIADFDILIAAHALATDCTLVTNNVRHFARIPSLAVENWL